MNSSSKYVHLGRSQDTGRKHQSLPKRNLQGRKLKGEKGGGEVVPVLKGPR